MLVYSVLPSTHDLILLTPQLLNIPPNPSKPWTLQAGCLGLVVSSAFYRGQKVYKVMINAKAWKSIRKQVPVENEEEIKKAKSEYLKNNHKASSSEPNINPRYAAKYLIVTGLQSSWREFHALHEAGETIPLINDILAEQITQKINHSSAFVNELVNKNMPQLLGVSQNFVEKLKEKCNPSQLEAIANAATNTGFTLIQGPPGTGKTSTIIRILNSLHLREYNRFYMQVVRRFVGDEGMRCREVFPDPRPWIAIYSSLLKTKPHILVVAPSNAAVDNICLRIMKSGFVDSTAETYYPDILRVGRILHKDIGVISLEEKVNRMRISSTPFDELSRIVPQLNKQIEELLMLVMHLQSSLINLMIALQQCNPLPKGWELRVRTETAIPYWVNHIDQVTSSTPPIEQAKEAYRQGKISYVTLELLPSYIKQSREFLRRIQELYDLVETRNRFQDMLKEGNVKEGHMINSKESREYLESKAINRAALLFTTLNSCGHPSMEGTEFCVTVIDEAAQCVEPSTLIALKRGTRQCVMVGDQQQLTATIFSNINKAKGYDISLFERLMNAGHPYIMLDTQYRMTPEIAAFPSLKFYDGKLLNGHNVCMADYVPNFIRSQSRLAQSGVQPLLSPFLFFNLQSSQDRTGSSLSKVNEEEVRLCMNLMMFLLAQHGHLASDNDTTRYSIGIITPYSEQLTLLRQACRSSNLPVDMIDHKSAALKKAVTGTTAESTLAAASNSKIRFEVDLNTVDGFQGQEKDFIIISTVRANDDKSIGFLSDIRRMNVALTRARYGMYVIGSRKTLVNNKYWRELINHAQSTRSLLDVTHANVNLQQALIRHHNHPQPSFKNNHHNNAQQQPYKGKQPLSLPVPPPTPSLHLPEPVFSPATPHVKSIPNAETVSVADNLDLPPSKKRKVVLTEDDNIFIFRPLQYKEVEEEPEDGEIFE